MLSGLYLMLTLLTVACAARTRALAARLGPGIARPRDFAVYPRAALLDEFVATLDAAHGAGRARLRATFGAPDLALAAAVGGDSAVVGRAGTGDAEAALRPVVATVARSWRHGDVRVLSGAARGGARGVAGRRVEARTLGCAARDAARGAPSPAGGDLTVIVAPRSARGGGAVARLQLVCAHAAHDGACCLLLNPRLALPSPVAAGATMAPLLLSDFERVYEASADALRVAGRGDHGEHGVALYRRWPEKRYRLFVRDGDRFDFVGNSARRPGADQLRAIYVETCHRVYDGS